MNTIKLLVLGFLAPFLALGDECAPVLTIARGVGTNLNLSWSTLPQGSYQLFSANALMSAWVSNGSSMIATSRTLSASASAVGQMKFYRVSEIAPLGGLIALTNGSVLSNTVAITFSTFANGANIQYVALEDIVNGETNDLGIIDYQNSPTNVFVVNTTNMQNFIEHRLRIRIVDTYGDANISDNVREWCTPVTRVFAKNFPVSVRVSQETGFKFWLGFTASVPATTWQVIVTNDVGSLSMGWSGMVASSTNALGEIFVEDTNALDSVAYDGAYLYGTIRLTTVSFGTIITRFSSRIVHPNEVYESCVVWDSVAFHASSNLNARSCMVNATLNLNYLGNNFLLQTQTRETIASGWNNLSSTTWPLLPVYLSGQYIQPPSHLVVLTKGSPVRLGDPLNTMLQMRVLSGGTNLTFGVFAGHDVPYGFLYRCFDTKPRTRAEMKRLGLHPRFALYSVGLPLARYVGGDLDDDYREFLDRFINRAFELDSVFGLPIYSLEEALAYANLRSNGTINPLASYFRYVGCAEMKAHEIYFDDWFFEF